MTKDQYEVYRYLVEYTSENGYPPLVREIGEGLSEYSIAKIREVLRELSKSGYITVKDNSARAIKINGYEFRPKEKDK